MLQSNVGTLNTSENQKMLYQQQFTINFINIGIQVAWAA